MGSNLDSRAVFGTGAGFETSSCPESPKAIGMTANCNPAFRTWSGSPSGELAVDRAAKKEMVETLNSTFKSSGVAVVAHYSGLTVAQMQILRKQMKAAGGAVKVAKNRLAKIALEGTDVVSIAPLLKGPTVIATSSDPITAPKIAVE